MPDSVVCLMRGVGLNPEPEKPGLLSARPPDAQSIICDDDTPLAVPDRSLRRPADIFLVDWHARGLTAFDFAIVFGLGRNVFRATLDRGEAAVEQYEERKRAYLNTARPCAEEVLSLQPIVMEAHSSAWGLCAYPQLRPLAPPIEGFAGEYRRSSVVCNTYLGFPQVERHNRVGSPTSIEPIRIFRNPNIEIQAFRISEDAALGHSAYT